jgi:CAAX prenyl protease-like protein
VKAESAHEAPRGSLVGQGALPYVAPFGVFLAFLAIDRFLPFRIEWNHALRFGVVFGLLIALSRGVIPRRISNPLGSIVLGVAVFFIWIGPDLLWPAYRQTLLFHNGIVGAPESSLPQGAKGNVMFLVFRVLSSVVNVPVLEELFWRGWLMRWLISADFGKVPLGSYSAQSFWFVAVLFAVEHGSYWDVGLIAGILYNWWMIRTRSLSDCMLAHAVTNACLAWYVVARDQWHYWL